MAVPGASRYKAECVSKNRISRSAKASRPKVRSQCANHSFYISLHSQPPVTIHSLRASPRYHVISRPYMIRLTTFPPIAISKRFPTDSGGNKGPRSSHEPHHGGPSHHRGGKRKDDHHAHSKGPDPNQRAAQGAPGGRDNVGVAPPTPGFGAGFPFTIPMMPGFAQPQYPGFPGGGAQQPGGDSR
jgi:hypothetical protein